MGVPHAAARSHANLPGQELVPHVLAQVLVLGYDLDSHVLVGGAVRGPVDFAARPRTKQVSHLVNVINFEGIDLESMYNVTGTPDELRNPARVHHAPQSGLAGSRI